jgi:hypothetical protein
MSKRPCHLLFDTLQGLITDGWLLELVDDLTISISLPLRFYCMIPSNLKQTIRQC